MGLTGVSVADNINVNGTNRDMLVYAPKNIEKNRPLIIQMHGYNQDAAYQKNAAKWEPVADTGRFVVVFPNGQNRAWDTGGDKDLNFIKAIINEKDFSTGGQRKSPSREENAHAIEYRIAECCHPSPGDPVIGFSASENLVMVHKKSCPGGQDPLIMLSV